MAWLDNPIDGQQSVSANKAPLNADFQYIADTMKLDHFWDNANSNLDGYHQFVSMPKNGGGSPSNPSIATDMDGVYFCKDKTSADAPDIQTTEPFFISNDGSNDQVLQLGIRAMGHFTISGTTLTEKYIHNCSIARTAAGLYTVTFDTALPSTNYIVLAGAIRNGSTNPSGGGVMTVQSAASKATSMTTTFVKLEHKRNTSNDLSDPLAGWFAVFGG